jgi:PadR family transcriptional regulator, regulatory protein AphA
MDVRTICLGILTRGDATGYEIKKLFEEEGTAFFVEASFGSIYPALNKLTEDGLVSVREEAQAKRPDRKVYTITPAGRQVFLESLLAPLPEDRFRSPFLFAMLFCDLLPQERVRRLLDDYIAQADLQLSRLEKELGEATSCNGERFVRDFGRTMYVAMLQYLRERRSEFRAEALKAAE